MGEYRQKHDDTEGIKKKVTEEKAASNLGADTSPCGWHMEPIVVAPQDG